MMPECISRAALAISLILKNQIPTVGNEHNSRMLLIYKYVTEREKKEKWQQRGNLQLIYGYLRISL